ncbi:phage major capsid protein [Mycobacterium paragordonae]|uniref:Phage major capsid protein n=1 Tax=Mycobacterium paragordonae TaxID=1389713 RepID=A0AAJ1S0N8_9MYCO|nr:phage major capsid protein [Mycobacterium paragordonae]MDP7733647.1 phage major capsid protein [Mycobacterium paragordonae]
MAFSSNDSKLAQTSDTMFSGYLDPHQAKDYFAEAEKTSIIQQVATKIPMGASGEKIPHWTGDVQASWVGEAEMKPITKGNLTSQVVKPHKIATIFTASAEVVRANPANYLSTMRTKVATAIAMAFDAAALHGTNTPFDQYLDQTTKVRGLKPNAYDTLGINGLGDLVNDGKRWSATLLDDVVEPILNAAKDDAGRPLFIESTYEGVTNPFRQGRILGRPTILSDHVKKTGSHVVGYQGDFSQIVWGQVGGLSYKVSNEATINYGTAESPNLISLFQHNLVAVLVEAEFGLLINDVDAFVKLTDQVDINSYTVTLASADSGDTWTLKVNGVETGTIAYNAAASAVKTAIVAVDDSILAADVTVTGSAGAGYTVTLPGTLAHGTDTGLTSTVTLV